MPLVSEFAITRENFDVKSSVLAAYPAEFGIRMPGIRNMADEWPRPSAVYAIEQV
ncbi:hypothetical protein [Methylobacterium mesophilicum]|uniref:hypothetical protein n=1 Tax=Methylobacterium mesophilicum TaxID=39956 RepID=UPI001EE2A9C9|nr:hypothetical protein [Methylobacterium mesophilicum]